MTVSQTEVRGGAVRINGNCCVVSKGLVDVQGVCMCATKTEREQDR